LPAKREHALLLDQRSLAPDIPIARRSRRHIHGF
jgi:hypothetical protein